MLTAAELAARFRAPEHRKDGWWVFCPVHADGQKRQRRSLRIADGRRGTLLKCWAGCAKLAILAAVGCVWADVCPAKDQPVRAAPAILAVYDYEDETGTLLYQVVRLAPKEFRQRRPHPTRPGQWEWKTGDRPILYKLADLTALRPTTVVVPEGEKDCDALWALGLPATTNAGGAGNWRGDRAQAYVAQLRAAGATTVIVLPDNDEPGRGHGRDIAASTVEGGLTVRWCDLPGLEDKEDVSDWLAKPGNTADMLRDRLAAAPTWPPVTPHGTRSEVHATFKRWFGEKYDPDVLNAVLATAACHWVTGDPPWLLVIGGPGDGKTETLSTLATAGAMVVSTIISEGALLSGSSRRDRAQDATGGLLQSIGARGILVVKDWTSILSVNATTRAQVHAAFREIYDGKWVRVVGAEGGRTLTWEGRLVVIGACTTAWDAAHAAIAAMGDRFLIIRSTPSDAARLAKSAKAQDAIGREAEMREELGREVGKLLGGLTPGPPIDLEAEARANFQRLATLVATLRTAVEHDQRGAPTFGHQPEVASRLIKQLGQVMRGAVAIGLTDDEAQKLAKRIARDTVPPTRLRLLADVLANPGTLAADAAGRVRITRSHATVVLDELYLLGILNIEEVEPINEKPWMPPKRYYEVPPASISEELKELVRGISLGDESVTSHHDRQPGDDYVPF
jgi:hypothetical protein